MPKKKLRPVDVAEALGISTQTVRVALQQGLFPFGWAVKTSKNRYAYAISPKLFEEYLGTYDGNNPLKTEDDVQEVNLKAVATS